MAKITKGFAYGIATLGALCLFLSIGAIVSGGFLANIVSTLTVEKEHTSAMVVKVSNITAFKSYWWFTFFYLVPSILGLIVGCTRHVFVVVFYTVFNIVSLIASSIGTILLALLLAVWSVTQARIDTDCISAPVETFKSCICNSTTDHHSFTFVKASCGDLYNIEGILIAVVSLVTLQLVVSFIGSFVSCYSLCNQEESGDSTDGGATFPTGPFGGPYGGTYKHNQYEKL